MTYKNIDGENIIGNEKKVDFRINKMTREKYDELCAAGYMDEHPYDLYLVDDVNFDLQGKRIINVGAPDPDSKLDTPNLDYLEKNFISKNYIKEYSDNSFYIQNSKIISHSKSYCLSCDGNFYKKLSSESDWKIDAISCPYDVSQMSVYYRDDTFGPPLGWTIKVPGNNVAFPFNVEDSDVQYLYKRFEDPEDGTLCGIISISRDVWSSEPFEKLLKSSDIELSCYLKKDDVKKCLSSISSDNCEIGDIFNALSAIKDLVE